MVYLDNSNIEQYILGKKVWAFGAGLSGDEFIKLFGQ